MILLNGQKLKVKQFPNGETLIKTEDLVIKEKNNIVLKFENDMDLMNLMFITNHIKNFGGTAELIMPYMPYSRMDRTEGTTVFTLKYICQMINDLHFNTVTIDEAHSDVCVALLDRVIVENLTAYMAKKHLKILNEQNRELRKPVFLVYPDGGATKRYSKQIHHDKVLTCTKERDFKTGYIKKLTIDGEIPKEPFKAIIVDDLCSRGGTFILTAEKLKEIGAEEIILIVTHCENTILDGDIFKTDLINRVITTNSILNEDNKEIKQLINTGRLEILKRI